MTPWSHRYPSDLLYLLYLYVRSTVNFLAFLTDCRINVHVCMRTNVLFGVGISFVCINVCVGVCVCVSVYVYECLHVYVYMCNFLCVCVRARARVCVCVCTHVFCRCVFSCLYLCMFGILVCLACVCEFISVFVCGI